jgi:hypothetical protein
LANAKIVWIASYPKSGNTWIRIIVDRLLSRGEPLDINALSPSFKPVVADYLAAMKIDPAKVSRAGVISRWPDVERFLVERATRPRVFVKTHNVSALFGKAPFPTPSLTAGALYVVRDPRDVALSYAYHFDCSPQEAVGALCDPEKGLSNRAAPVSVEIVGSWGVHVRSWLFGKKFPLLLLRYEDMLEDPERAILDIGRFLSLEPTAAEAARIAAEASFGSLKTLEVREGFREAIREGGFFRKGKAGEWRTYPHQAHFDPLIAAFGPLMKRLNYPFG